MKHSYWHGKFDGPLTSWYGDGTVAREEGWVQGKKHGLHRGWTYTGAWNETSCYANNLIKWQAQTEAEAKLESCDVK